MVALSLSGKVALVTGSSRGIGAAIALKLAADGANVVVNYANSSQPADEVAATINAQRPSSAIAIKANMSSISDIELLLSGTLKAFGKLDILVLNAGIMGNRTLQDIDETYYNSHFDANVKGPLFLVKAAQPYLSPGARVIFFSSSLTRASMVPSTALVYVATKGAIEQIARVLAKDLGASEITVNTVSPGPVDTDLFRADKSESQIQFFRNLHPSKRLGQTDDISAVVAFLVQPEAKWINGQNILVNGGFVV